MKSIFSGLVLFGASLVNAQAAILNLGSLTINEASVSGTPVPGFTVDLDILDPSTNILAAYASIAVTSIGGADQFVYTAASNTDPNGMGPPAGSVPGGPVPSGTVDDVAGTIEVDMSSWFSDHGPFDQNLGGTATGLWNSATGDYQMAWTVALNDPRHPAFGSFVTWTVHGVASPVPVPAAVWLFGSGLLGLAGIARRKHITRAA